MVKRKTAIRIRKAHRYLGIFLGIQFLLWTISGMYFSWTNIDEIHGDHFKRETPLETSFTELKGIGQLKLDKPVKDLTLIEIAGAPYYWINGSSLYHAITGLKKEGLTQKEALSVAHRFMKDDLEVSGVIRLDSVGPHNEYRGRPLPAYEISYKSPEDIKAYVAVKSGAFQTVRHRDWRWFDFLWMTHTMDYQGRDDFNTTVLRIFSLLGLITVLSGFLLWFTSSASIRRIKKIVKKRT
ncbi:hypothetical protein ACJD0Z_11450 [Flavobacteriaceae bacterium M23B6Z8]